MIVSRLLYTTIDYVLLDIVPSYAFIMHVGVALVDNGYILVCAAGNRLRCVIVYPYLGT